MAISFKETEEVLVLATAKSALPILLSGDDVEAVRIAAGSFANDVERVVGSKVGIHHDTLPNGTSAIIAATVGSSLHTRLRNKTEYLDGKWESFVVRVEQDPLPGLRWGLVIIGSDPRGVIYALYTLSEQMGVSPWYWWADVPVRRQTTVAFHRDAILSHGEPSVKYRGFFLNDEQPVLWNWAREHFKMGSKPPFQVEMYEKVFELLLRLRGNYSWPAMWASMFAADGMDVECGLPDSPIPGPNQDLASRMGIVMGTSHHEPMSRNQKEWTTWGTGPWDFTKNAKALTEFWRYGAERAKSSETIFTVGMRGDGDLPLEGGSIPIIENIARVQQDLLREVYGEDLSKLPQMWAMYKEVMADFANGLTVPDEVTPLLADDNWGNLMAVMPTGKDHAGGGGIYYHADYVGDPRDYKWINTVPLAKMWEQLSIARAFKTDRIWILNVGDLKGLETPLEYFMSIAYDAEALEQSTLLTYLAEKAERDFPHSDSQEIAEVTAKYSILASRRKAELLDSQTYSLVDYSEAETILADWVSIEERAKVLYDAMIPSRQTAFYELHYSAIQLQTNLTRLYISAAKSNLYATQGRSAANLFADDARRCFDRDYDLTQAYHQLEGGKWNHMLSQTHIHYQYWQAPMRNAMPPVTYISARDFCYDHGTIISVRYTVENSLGAWPGDNKHNCPLEYSCPDPTLLPMSRYGRPRWVDVCSGGPSDVVVTVTPRDHWLIVSTNSIKIKGDGSTDTRVVINVDWDKLEGAVSGEATDGHVLFNSSDEAKDIVVTIPVRLDSPLPEDFHGAVLGDGYVAIEAAHHQRSSSAIYGIDEYAWKDIPFYGRTLSGLAIHPVADIECALRQGPSVEYDFWVGHTTETNDAITVILHIGPSLNYILGKRLAIAVQIDDTDPVLVHPVPVSKPGSLPDDWEDVVADEIRKFGVEARLGGKLIGKHKLTVWGVTGGIVLERIIIDMGGVRSRGKSYLGPSESVIV